MLKPDYQIRPLEVSIENVGKLIQGSKRRYHWKFQSPTGVHTLKLTLSIVSSKFKLSYDEVEVDRGEIPFFQAFEYRWARDDLRFLIEQQKTNMKLYINEQLFEPNVTIDVWLNRNGQHKRSNSTSKPMPKESQLDRPIDRRQTEYGLGVGLPMTPTYMVHPSQPRTNFAGHPPLPPRREELEKIKFNKGLLTGTVRSLSGNTGSGPSASRLSWRELDPYEEQPDHFFVMTFNQDTKMVMSIINRLYSP